MTHPPLLQFFNPESRLSHWECQGGQKWLLCAPTGWGKTVWLRQLALIREAEKSTITWNGNRVTPQNVGAYRSSWILNPQIPYRSNENVLKHFEDVFGLGIHRQRNLGDWKHEFRNALNELGLNALELQTRSLQQLSGGEIQAISLIRSVLLQPQGLFLDEPTSAMDLKLCLRIETWLEGNFRGAWIWVSHDEHQAERLLQLGALNINIENR